MVDRDQGHSVDVSEIKTARDFEAFLRQSGFSRAAAKSIAGGGWSALSSKTADTEPSGLISLLATLRDVGAQLKDDPDGSR